jgi:hypothetical protein
MYCRLEGIDSTVDLLRLIVPPIILFCILWPVKIKVTFFSSGGLSRLVKVIPVPRTQMDVEKRDVSIFLTSSPIA